MGWARGEARWALLGILALAVAGCGDEAGFTSAGDSTPPAAVRDLGVVAVADTSVALRWSAPGDDGAAGTAARYDIRYSTTDSLTEENWGLVTTAVDSPPAPQPSGREESFVVVGLSATTRYFLGLKSADEVPNWSPLSNAVRATTLEEGQDGTPPASIGDLGVTETATTSIRLEWTAPGDDGFSGTASAYDLRYSTGDSLTEESWADALPVTEGPVPGGPGSVESFTVTGLDSGTTYAVGLKAADEVPNWSGLSNVAVASTWGTSDDAHWWDGFDPEAGNGMLNPVYALETYGDALVAGGSALKPGEMQKITRWNGMSWDPLGSGISGNVVVAMTVYGDDLVVGGSFDRAGGLLASNIASWDGSVWRALASEPDVYAWAVSALVEYEGALVEGGSFSPEWYLARWDGVSWEPLGNQFGGEVPHVFALTVQGERLIVGGGFLSVGDTEVNHIARWDAESWEPLGLGTDGAVRALTVFRGDLIAAGEFTQAGGVSVGHIAAWNGTSWSSLGLGVNGTVLALAVYDGALVAGGAFTEAGGSPAQRVARWDGTSWRPLGSGVNGTVYALAVYEGDLFAGGEFTTAGTKPSGHIARWEE